jgi:hypothetical protein
MFSYFKISREAALNHNNPVLSFVLKLVKDECKEGARQRL